MQNVNRRVTELRGSAGWSRHMRGMFLLQLNSGSKT